MRLSLIVLFISAFHFATLAQSDTPNNSRLPEGNRVLTKGEIHEDSAGTLATVDYKPEKETKYFSWYFFPTMTFASESKSSTRLANRHYLHNENNPERGFMNIRQYCSKK